MKNHPGVLSRNLKCVPGARLLCTSVGKRQKESSGENVSLEYLAMQMGKHGQLQPEELWLLPEFMSMKIVEAKSKCNPFMSSLTRFRLSDCQLYAVIVIIAYGNYTATLCPLYLPLRSPIAVPSG